MFTAKVIVPPPTEKKVVLEMSVADAKILTELIGSLGAAEVQHKLLSIDLPEVETKDDCSIWIWGIYNALRRVS